MDVSVRLLGTPAIGYRGEWLEVPAGKTSGLLYYLAYQGGWVEREDLLYLLWPDTPQKNAQDNLKQRVYETVHERPFAADLESERFRVRWQVSSDVETFRDHITNGRWCEAAQQYRGNLLEGFRARRMPEYEGWLEQERRELATAWREAALRCSDGFVRARRYTQAAELLQRVHRADPFDEVALRRLMGALYRSGDRHRALALFDTFAELLHDDIGVEPEQETLHLALHIREEQPLEAAMGERETGPRSRLTMPTPTTPFVGRAREIDALAAQLTDSACRLLTIVAPGGMGKTRLAIEVGRRLDPIFRNGAHFVSFADVTASNRMATTLAVALGIQLSGNREPEEQLLGYLRDKEMLLVLDNLEHLLDGVGLIADILAAAPGSKVLATSRERLKLHPEHIVDLSGLNVPDEASEALQEFDALELFAQAARRARSDFSWNDGGLAAAVGICRLVEGMPLAIELAASWLRVLSAREIVPHLERALDFLETEEHDLPVRFRGIRGVFAGSWERLSEGERSATRKISVFRGGFTQEAARTVADVGLPLLLALVNKGFVRRESSGRFSRHVLVLQYTREKLAEQPDEQAESLERHAMFFLGLAEESSPHIRGEHYLVWLDRFEEEHENLQAALEWLLDNNRGLDALRMVGGALGDFWGRRSYFRLGQEWSERTLSHPSAQERSKERARVLLGGLASWGDQVAERSLSEEALAISRELGDKGGISEALNIMGSFAMSVQQDFATARSLFEQSLTIQRELEDQPGIAANLKGLGTLARVEGDFAAARSLAEQSLAIRRELRDDWGISYLFNDLGRIDLAEGDTTAARSLFEQSLAIRRELGDRGAFAYSLNHFGSVARAEGDLIEARSLFEQSLAMRRESGEYLTVAWVLNNLAEIAQAEGDYAAALSLAEEGLGIVRKLGDRHGIAISLQNLGALAEAEGDHAAARSLFAQSLAIFREVENTRGIAECLESLALVASKEGHAERAVHLLGAAEALREAKGVPMPPDRRDRLDAAIGSAREALGDEVFSATWEQGKGMTLEALLDAVPAKRSRS